jgi:hypothetical protein
VLQDEAVKTLKVRKTIVDLRSCLHCTDCSTAPECISGTIIQCIVQRITKRAFRLCRIHFYPSLVI